ncbi:hypothetical protein KPSA1_04639 [Pseudomonas syringae pv. actinidiae]|uniref:Uncharacterized protein n=1 Tax=Pseudomonas syringae pv. actinidiae TaxID=103796 RepID=A0A2V0QE33_PSESF|nr:hypothetical protein KPSA1_04639 [Pseudomonas syringae pv. actinidiae]
MPSLPEPVFFSEVITLVVISMHFFSSFCAWAALAFFSVVSSMVLVSGLRLVPEETWAFSIVLMLAPHKSSAAKTGEANRAALRNNPVRAVRIMCLSL